MAANSSWTNNRQPTIYCRYDRSARQTVPTVSRSSPVSNQTQGISQQNRWALCIGIDYLGSSCRLSGCQADANYIHQWLIQDLAFPADNITLLLDLSPVKPTKQNILQAINKIVTQVKPGDLVYFHFSGHGSQTLDLSGDESDHRDETIIPVDYNTQGVITDDVLRQQLVNALPENSTLIAVLDCCHSGTGLDLRYNLTPTGIETDQHYQETKATVHCLSGCRDNQTSADTVINNQVGGACTLTYLSILRENKNINLSQLLTTMHQQLAANNYYQRPQITLGRASSLDTKWLA